MSSQAILSALSTLGVDRDILQRNITASIREEFSEESRAKMVADLAEALGVSTRTFDTRRELSIEEKQAILKDVAESLGLEPLDADVEFELSHLKTPVKAAAYELTVIQTALDKLTRSRRLRTGASSNARRR